MSARSPESGPPTAQPISPAAAPELSWRLSRFALGGAARLRAFNVICHLPRKASMAEDPSPLHPASAEVLESFVLHVLLDLQPTACDAAVLGSLWQAARDGAEPSTSDQRTASAEALANVHEAVRSLERIGLADRVGPEGTAWTTSLAARRAGELLSRV